MAPFLHERHYGRGYVQRTQLIVGLMYTFTINSNHTVEDMEYQFMVTRDRNKEFHIYKQTKVASMGHLGDYQHTIGDGDTCIDKGAFLPWADLLPPLLSKPQSSSMQSLKVASYNIWNVNSLRHEGDKYEDRLGRLGKVRHLNIVVHNCYPSLCL